MSKFNVSLGKWIGIPVYLHWSWMLLFIFILITNPSFAVIYAGLFFIVLLHELGHCLAAQYFDTPTDNITLWPFGGIASIKIPQKPKQEFFVALAGPAVNVLLVPLLMALGTFLPEGHSNFWIQLGYYNAVFLIFNLVPAFPMDGGRIFRSLLSMFFRNHLKATLIAVRVGQVICIVFGVLGVVYGAFMLVLIAFFIFMGAQSELNLARICDFASTYSGYEVTDFWEAEKVIERKLRQLEGRNLTIDGELEN